MSWDLAAVLATGEPERMYSGLSLLVSTAADGRSSAGLLTFQGLELFLADDLFHRGIHRGETFANSLVELRDTALELSEIYACSASEQTIAVDVDRLAGVMSTPRFLERAGDARLVFV